MTVLSGTTVRKESTRGATAVEFALVLPWFALLMFGVIDFGRYFYVQHTLQYATREGARLALVGGTLADEKGEPLTRIDSIIKKIQESAILINIKDLEISVSPIQNDYSDKAGWEKLRDAGEPGDYMRVHTRYTYRFIVPYIDELTGKYNVIEAATTYRNELF